MRPIRLELKGFTAFRDEQVLDLEGLDLFAISGPTGSGKTSILDAITYALFGTIERVGRQAGQFISQGQTRMAVCLEFAVDDVRYRVTRSTPARGATKILLERADGDAWVQAGDGADKVNPANELIRGAIGLDYEAFTRSVLLPQGRFAEFLVGDAKERRDILTELLGLELFERLARRAGECRRDAHVQAETRSRLLETEYAGVTAKAVEEARSTAEAARGREEALAQAEAKVQEMAARWAETERAIREVELCGRDVRDAAGLARRVAEGLEEVAARWTDAEADLAELGKAVVAAEGALAKATAAREEAEASWGSSVDLAGRRATAGSLIEARGELAETQAALAEARGELPASQASEVEAAEALALAIADSEAATRAREEAETVLEAARHADLVAAVRAGVGPGDECPVCGAKVTALPKAPRAVPLEEARAALERARTRAEDARTSLTAAERAKDAASASVGTASAEVVRREEAVARARAAVERLEAELAPVLGGKVPEDPVAVLEERLERLGELDADERGALSVLTEARTALTAAERRHDALARELAEARGALSSMSVVGLLDRARSLVPAVPPAPEPPPGEADATSLGSAAAELSAVLDASATTLDEAAAASAGREREAAREAAAHLDGLVEVRAEVVADAVEAAAAARTAAARQTATAEQELDRRRERLANAAALTEEVAEQRLREVRFDALAKELRADRIIAFLQLEALQTLAAAGSERLATLSSGRYRLEYEDDEFFVVDTWNGEERRSARTLSGGETFLASLALALALSEQVRSLSVTEKARLDSLFLDEGFGTLDPESLEVVVDAIEQLGGDGRMVGVITHVQELAVRLPARIEIEKSPRGSRLRVVA